MPRHMFQITVNLPASLRNNFNNNELLNPYIFVRNRLYHFVFHRFCLLYARFFNEIQRKLFEFFILVASLLCFAILVYVHVVFVRTPITCLEDYRDVWQNHGILRVEVITQGKKENYTLEDSYWKEKTLRLQQYDVQSYYFYSDHMSRNENEHSEKTDFDPAEEESLIQNFGTYGKDEFFGNYTVNSSNLNRLVAEESFQPLSEEAVLATDPDGAYIMEFSLEYGFLRLRPSKRKDLNISVTFVVLDPEVDQCFGGSFNKFLLDNFLGYDNVLLASIKNMAEKKDQKGFVRNAVMEIEYIFISNWTNEKSYLTAGFVMMIFTLTISTLLRHSHHQIFIVVGFWMQHIIATMERPSNFFDVVWPRNLLPSSGAPVLTVILALVGMEAVMSDFFHDRSIALHVIVIVWCADLYDAVCCQSSVSKRHWFKFFYLYHFMFYAYNYKFSGVYWPLTLTTSWLFTLHSMVFFFHHYELPRFLHRAARMQANIQPLPHNLPGNSPPPNQNQPPAQDPTSLPPNPGGPEDPTSELQVDPAPSEALASPDLVTENSPASEAACGSEESPSADPECSEQTDSSEVCARPARQYLQIQDSRSPSEETGLEKNTVECTATGGSNDCAARLLGRETKLQGLFSHEGRGTDAGVEGGCNVLSEGEFGKNNGYNCLDRDLTEVLHSDERSESIQSIE